MRTFITQLFTTVLIFSTIAVAEAETRYISDLLVVTVRSSNSNNYETLTTLITASPVEILDEDKSFVKVRTQDGIEGYILKQYVTKDVPKAIQLAELKKQKDALENKLKQQQLEFQDAAGLATSSQTIIDQLTSDLNQTKQQLDKTSTAYEQLQKRSANVLNLSNERDLLQEENLQISSELKVLQEENKGFHRTNMIQWFLAGGGVFFVGWLTGKISRKKRGYNRL